MKLTLKHITLTTALLLAPLATLQADLPDGNQALSPGQIAVARVVIGDPAKGAELPAAVLSAYARGVREVSIAPGTYRIPPTGKCAIELQHWSHAAIHAAGVTLIFEELTQRPLRLSHCDEVVLDGATLRFAEASFTQGRVKAFGEDAQGNGYLDWQIDAGYPVFDPVKSMLDVVDQNTRLIRTGTGDFGCKSAEVLGKGLYRLRHITGQLGTATVNDWLFTRRPGGGDSIIHLDRCGHCTMRNVTLQNAGFAAFFETDGEGSNTYDGCLVAPGPKPEGASEEELVGCGADGFHSAGTRIGPTINHCVWKGLLHDDCIAIHGGLQKVVRVEGSKLVLEPGNKGGFVAGEPVRISSGNGFFAECLCTNLRVLKAEGELLELTLDQESGAPADAKASNPRHNGAGYKILDCTLGNCRSRGILVKADHGLIEGCDISGCGMSAISIGPEYHWGEADYSQNVTVRGNTLRNNVLNGSDAGTIFVHGDGAIGNGNITIAGNLFDRNYGRVAVHAEDADGVLVDSNRFVMSPIPLLGKVRTILDFKSAQNIVLKQNVVAGASAEVKLVNLGPNVQSVTGDDTTGINKQDNLYER